MEKDYRRSLTKYLQFTLNRETESVREDFLVSLVEYGLFIGKNAWMTAEDINRSLSKEFRIDTDLTQVITSYLRKLVQSGRVSSDQGKYSLQQERRNDIEKAVEHKLALESRVFQKLLSLVEEKFGSLSSSQQEQLKENFGGFLLGCSVENASVASEIFIHTGKVAQLLRGCNRILNEVLRDVNDSALKDAQREAIVALFEKPDQDTSELSCHTLQSYLYFEILGFDPECRTLERRYLSEKSLYLDTNVILDLLLPERPRYRVASQVVGNSATLGVELKYTLETRKELFGVIDEYLSIPSESRDKIAEMHDIFLSEYHARKENNPTLTFEGYCLGLKRSFTRTMQEQFSIHLDNEPHDNIHSHQEFSKFVEVVTNQASRDYVPKTFNAVLHDSFHLLLIRELRKLVEWHTPCWFLTFDNSLYQTSVPLIEKGLTTDPPSVCGGVWLSTVAPFLNLALVQDKQPEISRMLAEFTGLTLTRTLPTIPLHKLPKILGPWLEYDLLTTEELEDIARIKLDEKFAQATRLAETEGPLYAGLMPAVNEKLARKLSDSLLELRRIRADTDKTADELRTLKEEYSEATKSLVTLRQNLDTLGQNIQKNVTHLAPLYFATATLFGVLAAPVWYFTMSLLGSFASGLLGITLGAFAVIFTIIGLLDKRL